MAAAPWRWWRVRSNSDMTVSLASHWRNCKVDPQQTQTVTPATIPWLSFLLNNCYNGSTDCVARHDDLRLIGVWFVVVRNVRFTAVLVICVFLLIVIRYLPLRVALDLLRFLYVQLGTEKGGFTTANERATRSGPNDWTGTGMWWGEMKNTYRGKCWGRIYQGKGREDDRKQDERTNANETWKVLDWERARRWTGRHGVGRSSVVPATLDDRKGTGLRAGEETDRATWSRKIISHNGDPRWQERYWTESGRGDGQGDME